MNQHLVTGVYFYITIQIDMGVKMVRALLHLYTAGGVKCLGREDRRVMRLCILKHVGKDLAMVGAKAMDLDIASGFRIAQRKCPVFPTESAQKEV